MHGINTIAYEVEASWAGQNGYIDDRNLRAWIWASVKASIETDDNWTDPRKIRNWTDDFAQVKDTSRMQIETGLEGEFAVEILGLRRKIWFDTLKLGRVEDGDIPLGFPREAQP